MAGSVLDFSPEPLCAGEIKIDVSRPGRLIEWCISGRSPGKVLAGLFHNLRVRGQNCQTRAEVIGLPDGHTLKNSLASRLTGDGEDKGAFRPGRGHGHRPFSKLRPGDPCHGNGKGRYVEMDDVTVHNKGARRKVQGSRCQE